MFKISCRLECVILPIKSLHPSENVRSADDEIESRYIRMNSRITIPNSTNVAIEVTDVDRIKSNLDTIIE